MTLPLRIPSPFLGEGRVGVKTTAVLRLRAALRRPEETLPALTSPLEGGRRSHDGLRLS
jgi:hypothetical protein